MTVPAPPGAGLVVLTGGASTRMGVDKAVLDAGGVPLVLRPVLALRDLCPEAVLAGRAVPGVGLPVIPDPRPGLGPLAGVVSGAARLESELVVVVACDMPGIEAGLVKLLLGELIEHSTTDAVACADASGRIEPLPMALRRAAVGRLGALVDAGGRSLQEGLSILATRLVPEPVWRAVDPDGASFENWNRPADVRPVPPVRPPPPAAPT